MGADAANNQAYIKHDNAKAWRGKEPGQDQVAPEATTHLL